MTRLRAKLFLWWNGYCTKHKTLKRSGRGSIRYCAECGFEATLRKNVKITAAKRALEI